MTKCISKYNKYTNSNSNSSTILVSKNYHEPVSVLEARNSWQVPIPCNIHRSQQDSHPA